MDWQNHLANTVPHVFIKPVFFAGLITFRRPDAQKLLDSSLGGAMM
jgi:hypothetical protein